MNTKLRHDSGISSYLAIIGNRHILTSSQPFPHHSHVACWAQATSEVMHVLKNWWVEEPTNFLKHALILIKPLNGFISQLVVHNN